MTVRQVYEAIEKQFQSDLNNNELRRNYDQFIADRDCMCEEYKRSLIGYEMKKDRLTKLTQILLDCAKNKITIPDDLVDSTIKLEKELSETVKVLNNLRDGQNGIEYQQRLIEKYEDYSDRKLFHYWNIMKVIGMTNDSYPDFKRKYAGKIF